MKQLGTLQIRIMRFIWNECDAVTVETVQEGLNAEPKAPELAYTTVGTVMSNLVKAGFLASKKGRSGPKYIFAALLTEEAYLKSQLKQIKNTFFDGDEHDLCNFIHTTLGKGDHA